MTSWLEILKDTINNKLVAYFLILWGATFLFSAISGLMFVADGYSSSIDLFFETLESLAEIGCTIILIMLGLKILNKTQ